MIGSVTNFDEMKKKIEEDKIVEDRRGKKMVSRMGK